MDWENIIQCILYGLAGVVVIIGSISFVVNQKKSVKEWLLLAVTEAEKALGEKTGKLKLRFVYENFVSLFPLFSKFIKFETFVSWVDGALDEMKKILKTNKAMQDYVGITVKSEGDDDGLGVSTEPNS